MSTNSQQSFIYMIYTTNFVLYLYTYMYIYYLQVFGTISLVYKLLHISRDKENKKIYKEKMQLRWFLCPSAAHYITRVCHDGICTR